MYSSQIIERLPNKPLTAGELLECVSRLQIQNFRGIFMINTLPDNVNDIETGIVNLDSINGAGTHWVCYSKNKVRIEYFDSFGNLRPPLELIRYFKTSPYPVVIRYNYFSKQKVDSVNCGHLCLDFLNTRK